MIRAVRELPEEKELRHSKSTSLELYITPSDQASSPSIFCGSG